MLFDVKRENKKRIDVNNVIYVSPEYIYYNKYINPKDIKEINKKIGFDNFIFYPRKRDLDKGDCGDVIESIIIPIAVTVFSSALFEVLKFAVIELVNFLKKGFFKDRDYSFSFRVYDEKNGFNISLSADVDVSDEDIVSILNKLKEIVEIAKK